MSWTADSNNTNIIQSYGTVELFKKKYQFQGAIQKSKTRSFQDLP